MSIEQTTPAGHPRWWSSVALTVALVLAMLPTNGALASPSAAVEPATVSPELTAHVEEAAASGETAQALVVLGEQARVERLAGDREAVLRELQATAAASEERFTAQLSANRIEDRFRVVTWFWIQNMALVEFEPAPGRVEALASLHGVERLVPNFAVSVIDPEPAKEVGTAIVGDRTWGLDRIEALRVHDELGLTGQGIRVATLDTGVDIGHPDLAGKMVTANPSDPQYPGGWMDFDANGAPVGSNPRDTSDHGTHVAGTIHGGADSGVAIGVAPDADMMHGLVIPGGGGSFAQVAAGMQWAIEPFDAAGNPAGEPADVVNMSLGGNGFHQEMIAPTRNMRAAGVYPSFAIGNNCGAAGTASPGNVYESHAVGATDTDDNVAGFSCGGVINASQFPTPPADWPTSYVKPDVSAPGVNTWSADPGGGYRYASGTSMATPHVAGTVALMLQAAPELDVDTIAGQLEDTAFFDDRHGTGRPNPRFGHGIINAYDAVEPIALDSGITGTVTDAGTGAPIAGATVAADNGSTSTTGAQGGYTLRLEPGSYALTADAFGYEPASVAGITVTEESFTTQDLALQASPTGSIAGTVVLADSGVGVPGATVTVIGTPGGAVTGPDGGYLVADVPVGTYEVAVTAAGFPAPDTQTVTVTEGDTETADFALPTPQQTVGVLGDHNGTIGAHLDAQGIASTPMTWADDPSTFATIVVNRPGVPGEDVFADFLGATDDAGTGVVFLDTWSTSGNGIWNLWTYLENPATRGTGYGSAIPALSYEVTAEHPILDGFEVGDEIVFDATTSFKDHAWFEGYEGEGRATIANAVRGDTGLLGGGIGVQEWANNRHALLSLHGASIYVDPSDWHGDSAQVFANALAWVTADRGDEYPLFVVSDLEVAPDAVLPAEPVEVSVDVTNVGTGAGEHTATLRVDGAVEDTTTVSLGAGESTSVTWTVRRDEIGSYEVQVGPLTAAFRVRAPIVSLTASSLDGPGAAPGPLAGATIDLLDGDDRYEVGTTDDEGALTFESPVASQDVVLVARRAAGDDHGYGYLLTRPVRLDSDLAVAFAPRTLASPQMTSQYVWNFAAVVDLQADQVSDAHTAWTYLRHGLTGPYGYAYEPGPVVVTVSDADGVDAVHAHQVAGLERDWWAVGEVVEGLDYRDPIRYEHAFGGVIEVDLDAAFTEGTQFAATWAVTDAHGNALAAVARTDLRPFDALPDAMPLEDVRAAVLGEAPQAAEAILRLYDPSGTAVHAGGLDWSQRTVERDLADLVDEIEGGAYTLTLEVAGGPFGTAGAEATMVSTAPTRSLSSDEVALGGTFTVDVTVTAPENGEVTLAESIAADTGAGAQRIGNGWPVVAWSTDTEVAAAYDDAGTWTVSGVEAGDTVTVTYTVAAPWNVVTPSTWVLSGTAAGDGWSQAVGGGSRVTVVDAPAMEVGPVTGTVRGPVAPSGR